MPIHTLAITPDSDLLTAARMADRLGISERSFQNLLKKGVPRRRFNPRVIRYDPAEVERWIATRTTTTATV